MNLQHQRLVIIGGTSGMGLAAAGAALAAGAHVHITSRCAPRAESAAARLASAPGARAQPHARVTWSGVDLADEASIDALGTALAEVDHVFVAAGATKLASPLSDEPLGALIAPLDDRIKGSLRLVRTLAPKVRPGGSFVFTGGLSTDRPIKGAWISGLATAGAEQLARVLAVELAPIRFNAISPGWTDTPMWDAVLGAEKEAVFQSVSAKWLQPRLVTPDEVAAAVMFLMSNHAMNAEVLHIDGGQRLC